jgi:uncharacterized protein
MTEQSHDNLNLIFSEGTQVVTLRDVVGHAGQILHPRGAVGVVVRSPVDLEHSYRVRFPDAVEDAFRRDEVVMLARYTKGEIGDPQVIAARSNLYERVIFRCVIGSRAYGLDDDRSDTDYRGIFLPSADSTVSRTALVTVWNSGTDRMR